MGLYEKYFILSIIGFNYEEDLLPEIVYEKYSVSVVIPTYNSSEYLDKAIVSVLEQIDFDLKFFEILLVDDNSKDLGVLAEKYSGNDYIRLLEKRVKTNAADSRNIGFHESRGDFVFFLDSDDEFLSGHIKKRINLHVKSRSGVVFGDFKLNGIDMKIPVFEIIDFEQYLFGFGGDIRSSTISIFKKHHKSSLFDGNQGKHQDWGFGIAASKNNERIEFDSDASININNEINPNRMSSSSNIMASKYFLDKYVSRSESKYCFVRAHLLSALVNEDSNALEFYKSIIKAEFISFSFMTKIKSVLVLILLNLPKPLKQIFLKIIGK